MSTNEEIRRRILEFLYWVFHEHPLGWTSLDTMLKKLNISEKKLLSNLVYIRKKNLIEIKPDTWQEGWGDFECARISTRGIDLIEKEESFEKEERKFYETEVFIVHGRDELSKTLLARMLEKMKMEPIILHEQPSKGMTLIEKLEHYSKSIGYAFVILTPDDVGALKEDYDNAFKTLRTEKIFNGSVFQHRARQNVVFELGWFQGKLGRNRVCLLYKKGVELPADIDGMVYSGFEDSIEECYKDIINELRAAGYKPQV